MCAVGIPVGDGSWWRRAALVATVPLNLRAAGGTGDRERTIAVCRHLVDDRDHMVVKALSWALRELAVWDSVAVQNFIDDHSDTLALEFDERC